MALWKKILIGVAAVIVAAVTLAYLMTGPLVAPVEAHLESIRAGNIDAAYDQTANAFRGATSREQYTQFVQSHPVMKNVASYSFTNRKLENSMGFVSGTLTGADGTVTPVIFRLVKENGDWKIIGISFDPADKVE